MVSPFNIRGCLYPCRALRTYEEERERAGMPVISIDIPAFFEQTNEYGEDADMQIYLLLTERCNLCCPMCIRGRQNGPTLSVNSLKDILERGDFNGHDLVLTGGEPTLHPNFSAIVEQVCRVAQSVTVTSNGTTDYDIDDMKKYPDLHVQISLDGDRAAHDMIRGTGAYEKAMTTIQRLDKAGMSYSVATVVSKKNVASMEDLCDILAELKGMRFWKLSYEMPFKSMKYSEMMTAAEWNAFVDRMIRRARLRLRVQKIFPFELYERYRQEGKLCESGKKRCFNCGGGSQKIYVYPGFDVYPCTCLTDFCVGNLLNETLEEILACEKLRPFLNYTVKKDAVCDTCEFKTVCNGGCIGMSYHYFGELGRGDIRCSKLGVMP